MVSMLGEWAMGVVVAEDMMIICVMLAGDEGKEGRRTKTGL